MSLVREPCEGLRHFIENGCTCNQYADSYNIKIES